MKKESTNSFVVRSKPWLIRRILSGYLGAKSKYQELEQAKRDHREAAFDDYKWLSDQLFTVKENLHLIFKRLIDPKSNVYENVEKFQPNKDETEFINNVGLLFHKFMVARELKYLIEHYHTDNQDVSDSQESLDLYWQRIGDLFEKGTQVLQILLGEYCTNLVVLIYLMQNADYIRDSIGESVDQILARCPGMKNGASAYMHAGLYCMESGWTTLASQLLNDGLKLYPQDHKIIDLIGYVESHSVETSAQHALEFKRAL